MKREKLKRRESDDDQDGNDDKDDDDKKANKKTSSTSSNSKKSVEELDPLIKKWRETFQEAAMDLFQRLRSQRGGGGGGKGSEAEGGGELTLENLLIHFRIDPDLVGLNREEDSFD